jgi:hypothetical protein
MVVLQENQCDETAKTLEAPKETLASENNYSDPLKRWRSVVSEHAKY